jgi:uncharacterized protein affecting Mg2+/Co2+ transport
MSPPVFTVNTGLRTLDETRRLLYVVTSYLATNSDKLSERHWGLSNVSSRHRTVPISGVLIAVPSVAVAERLCYAACPEMSGSP